MPLKKSFTDLKSALINAPCLAFLDYKVPFIMYMDAFPRGLGKTTLHELAAAQREHDVWRKVIYALESGDETQLLSLPVPFSQFFLSEDKVLCRYWAYL